MFIKQFISTFKKVRLEYKIQLQEQREKKALPIKLFILKLQEKYSLPKVYHL